MYEFFADLTAIAHGAYAAFVVFGLVIIVIGNILKWKWVQNRWFRLVHFAMIAVVVAEAWAGVTCPLTTLEVWLRDEAGQGFDATPVARFVHGFLFYDAPWWVFTTCYSLFGLLVLFTLIIDVRRHWRSREERVAA